MMGPSMDSPRTDLENVKNSPDLLVGLKLSM